MASLTDRIARDLIAENGWRKDQAKEFITGWGEETPFWKPVWKKVCKLSPATLGKIAFMGNGSDTPNRSGLSLYNIHYGTWLGKYESGKQIMRAVATTALICKIYDLLCAQASPVQQFSAKGNAFALLVLHINAEGSLVCSVYTPRHDKRGAFREVIWSGSRYEAIVKGYIAETDDIPLSTLPDDFWMPF